jgi:hypothetical protein
MKLTVIPSDNTVIMDGRALVFPFDAPSDLHAIQWHDDKTGDVATNGGKQTRSATLEDIEPYVTLFNAESKRLADIESTPPPEPTYQELRKAAYPPVSDYLDGIVKGSAEQVQEYVDACLAVKERFPKPANGAIT